MSAMKPEQFGQICEGVWHDRAAILSGRGVLSDEAALVRAVYWRLRKVGADDPDREIADYAPLIEKLVGQCRTEAA